MNLFRIATYYLEIALKIHVPSLLVKEMVLFRAGNCYCLQVF